MVESTLPDRVSTDDATAERSFRLLTATLLVAAIGISGYFRRRADRRGEAVGPGDERESRAGAAARWSGGLGMAVTVLTYLLAPRRVAWARLPVSRSVRWTGGVLAAICVPSIYWTFTSLDENVTPTERVRPTAELVTTGPYRWLRHPVYTIGAMFWIGIGLLAANGLVLLWLTVGLFGVVARTPAEERALAEAFGDEYREYAERTGRFLPRL